MREDLSPFSVQRFGGKRSRLIIHVRLVKDTEPDTLATDGFGDLSKLIAICDGQQDQIRVDLSWTYEVSSRLNASVCCLHSFVTWFEVVPDDNVQVAQ